MFKKRPQIKTLSPLRSSDRRKTADRIISDFHLEADNTARQSSPSQDETAAAEAKAAATAAHTALRNSLLPENSLSAKFTTTHGPQLKEVTGTVYVGGHSSGDQRVLWIALNDRLYPSVYTLWKNPGILPLLHTPSAVVQKLKGGADLMTPGLAGPPFPPRSTVGAVVAVASLDSPTVPVAVGTCLIDIVALQKPQETKGAAIETFHWVGDELWDWSTSGKPGVPPPESLEGWIRDNKNDAEVGNGVKGLSLEDGEEVDGGVALESEDASAESKPKGRNGYVDGEDAVVEYVDGEAAPDMTTKEIDEAFRNAFLYGVHHHKTANAGQKKYGVGLPLNQSMFMSSLVLPFLPTFTQKQKESLVMKKTSWKKSQKFIKSLDKEKILLAKERPGHEVDVWDIDFEDPAFADFQPYRLPKKEANEGRTGADASSSAGTDSADDSIGQKLKILDLFRPKDSLSPIFTTTNSGTKSLYTKADLRQITTSYIDAENLTSPTNKRLVTLNPILSNALFDPNSNRLDAEILAQGTIPRDALIERVLKSSNPYHVLLRNDESFDPTSAPSKSQGGTAKAKAGPAPKIGIVLETRSGNKTATRVHGLEGFYVRPAALADELRKVCASSTSVEALKGGKPGTLEVMVQGPQRDAIIKALDKRGVRKEWIEVADKTKGKKK